MWSATNRGDVREAGGIPKLFALLDHESHHVKDAATLVLLRSSIDAPHGEPNGGWSCRETCGHQLFAFDRLNFSLNFDCLLCAFDVRS